MTIKMVYPFLFSVISGFVAWRMIMMAIPKLERRVGVSQRLKVLEESKNQAEKILAAARDQTSAQLTSMREEQDILLNDFKEELDSETQLLDESEVELTTFEERVGKRQSRLDSRLEQLRLVDEQFKNQEIKRHETENTLAKQLSQKIRVSFEDEAVRRGEAIVVERTLEQQRLTRQVMDELNSQSRGLASRVLARVQSRYAPTFVWPKPSNVVELTDTKFAEKILSEEKNGSGPLVILKELSGTTVHIQTADGRHPATVRFGGGFGIEREAARMTLEQYLAVPNDELVSKWFRKRTAELEQEARRLGRIARETLHLKNMDHELLRLVGALNWRTSYRQNQWHHTLEVAQLAGLLAYEFGVDAEDAKRVGLLHDIGKALDYRIEGSHAVISGDYADRFGEKRYICDAVMSHHADLIVNSPLAFILQAADTLSGARPGARVNLEEGYQVRLTALHEVILSFPQVNDIAVMNGGREVHIQVKNAMVSEAQLQPLAETIAHKIEEEIAFPGQIKILLSRTYESVAVA